jgi:hypothetical protein
MPLRRLVVGVLAGLVAAALLAAPAKASDQESGSLSCAPGRVVWITERTSAGTTTVAFGGVVRKLRKSAWSTTKTRTGLRATRWLVTTTHLMDHQVTGASCGG